MANTNETIADIIAEIRLRGDIPREHTRPDGYGGYETITINRNEYLISIADRIEAAQKREVGNVAKMREALKQIASIPMPPPIHLAQQCAREMREKAIAALAASPRNCDKFRTDNAEASLAYEEFCDRAEVEESVNGAIAWLLSPDADKEGGNDGR